MEKFIPQENLYNITYMVTNNGERQEYALFVHGFNEMSAVVDGVSGIYNSKLGFENVAFKSIRLGTQHERDVFRQELNACDDEEADHV
ncbi:hypothetical protein AAH678_30210 [Sodalis endosymbiont of Spalangia cameroni]|uniref:hypothetical protein n=1 Tax=Sodalis praecaptivus TaxID=1239307 RepID=UPI0031F82A50